LFCPRSRNIAKLPFQVNGGLVYRGLIPARDDDYACFGVVYGKFSRNFARTVANAGEGDPKYELVFEWNYKIQLTKFAFVQPDVQWVINPGGTNRIPTLSFSERRWVSSFRRSRSVGVLSEHHSG